MYGDLIVVPSLRRVCMGVHVRECVCVCVFWLKRIIEWKKMSPSDKYCASPGIVPQEGAWHSGWTPPVDQNDEVQGLFHAQPGEPVSSSFSSPDLSFPSWREGIRLFFSHSYAKDKLNGSTADPWMMLLTLQQVEDSFSTQHIKPSLSLNEDKSCKSISPIDFLLFRHK